MDGRDPGGHRIAVWVVGMIVAAAALSCDRLPWGADAPDELERCREVVTGDELYESAGAAAPFAEECAALFGEEECRNSLEQYGRAVREGERPESRPVLETCYDQYCGSGEAFEIPFCEKDAASAVRASPLFTAERTEFLYAVFRERFGFDALPDEVRSRLYDLYEDLDRMDGTDLRGTLHRVERFREDTMWQLPYDQRVALGVALVGARLSPFMEIR